MNDVGAEYCSIQFKKKFFFSLFCRLIAQRATTLQALNQMQQWIQVNLNSFNCNMGSVRSQMPFHMFETLSMFDVYL